MDFELDFRIEEREPLKVLGMRRMAAADGFEERYAGLYRKAFQKKLQVVGAPIAVYHDQRMDGQISDIEAALPVNSDAEGVRELPGGTHCCVTHKGPYSTLPLTYAFLGMWLLENGYRISGAPYNLYVRGGNDKILPPEQYITEIFVPVEKIGKD